MDLVVLHVGFLVVVWLQGNSWDLVKISVWIQGSYPVAYPVARLDHG